MNEVLRQERKFLINAVHRLKIISLLESIMAEDTHNGINGYLIRSLYFDTPEDRDYNEKIDGLEVRRKIRLRIYDPDSRFAMLEIKQKQGSDQRKRSLRINRNDAEELISGNYSCLLSYKDVFAAECFYLMNSKCYRPKSIVEYCRKAYIAKENDIRITLDSDIRATESNYDIFSDNLLMYPVFEQFNTVLEVKYNGFLLSYIKDLIKETDCSETSVSKYCLSRKVGLQFNS